MNKVTKVILIIIVITVIFFVTTYIRGGLYKNKILKCQSNAVFCGIKRFKYNIPSNLKSQLKKCIDDKTIAKRVNIPGWKAGKTISTNKLYVNCPDIIEWYKNFSSTISELVGEKVAITSLDLPTSCCVLIYDEKDDFINWHFDVNYFNGKFFTVLLPISINKTCTQFIYKDHNEKDIPIDLINDECVVFEGDNLFHTASKLCADEKRYILCLQYSTDSHINLINKLLMNIKDMTYTGFI